MVQWLVVDGHLGSISLSSQTKRLKKLVFTASLLEVIIEEKAWKSSLQARLLYLCASI